MLHQNSSDSNASEFTSHMDYDKQTYDDEDMNALHLFVRQSAGNKHWTFMHMANVVLPVGILVRGSPGETNGDAK